MTLDTFCDKFRPILLGLMTEAYCFRKLPPSEFGMVMDAQHTRLAAILRQMFHALQAETPKPPAAPPPRLVPTTNGQHQKNNAQVA